MLEMMLTAISVAAAALGFLSCLAALLQAAPSLPSELPQALGGFYEAVVDKYYVDELYGALFVKPLVDGSTTFLWQGIDQDVIDATVDNSADGAREVSDTAAAHAVRQHALLRRMGRGGSARR